MTLERIKAGVDFMDPRIKVQFSIAPEVAEHLPTLQLKDIETQHERFSAFMGSLQMSARGVSLKIESILSSTEDDDSWYTEGKGTVEIDLGKIIQDCSIYSQSVAGMQGQSFLGMVHTHPNGIPKQKNQGYATPSEGDLLAIAGWFRDGLIRRDRPFIFAIASFGFDGQTHYLFYRPILKNGGIELVHLDGIDRAN